MNVLQEAESLIYGDRQASYGPPSVSFEKYAAVWGAILGVPVTAHQVALCMAGLKLCREAHKPSRDNIVDLAGYAGLAQRIKDE